MVHFTARGRRLLTTVGELVDEIEGDYSAILGATEFDRLRDQLHRIADHIDPGGALGAGDADEGPGARCAGRAAGRKTRKP